MNVTLEEVVVALCEFEGTIMMASSLSPDRRRLLIGCGYAHVTRDRMSLELTVEGRQVRALCRAPMGLFLSTPGELRVVTYRVVDGGEG